MQPLFKYWVSMIAVLLLAGCAAGGPKPSGAGGEQLPTFGGVEKRTAPELRVSDDEFIAKATKEFGDRQRASQALVEQGVNNFLIGDLAATMDSFNRARLLDADNPDAFWGFAMVDVKQDKPCDAKAMIDKALERNLARPTYLADAGRIYTLCAVSDEALTAAERRLAFEKSEEFFSRAASLAPKEEYIYGAWADAHYRQGHYADAWKMVKKQRAVGGSPDAAFLALLRAKLPEPK
jgi:Tfp pilus assembly protein PilF